MRLKVSSPSPALRQECARVFWRAVAGIFVGFWTQSWSIGALVFVGLWLGSQLRALLRLRAWLNRPKHVELPETPGLWGEVYDALYNLQRRNRKRKRRLAAMLAEFRASTAALPYGTVVLSSHGQIAWFNEAAQLLLGLDFRKDVGQRIPNLVRHPRFTEYFATEDYDHHIEVPSPLNPLLTLSLRVVPYGRSQRLLIVRDISESQRLEATRRDFVANASHELQAPLNILVSRLDALDPQAAPDDGWRQALADMLGQLNRMRVLLDDMMTLARMEADPPFMQQTRVDVPQLLETVRTGAESLSGGRHELEFFAEPGLCLIGHERELHSVFANLLDNAIRYTPAGGRISVDWRSEEHGACFRVRDSGPGIPERDLPRITERFYRVDADHSRQTGGTGLGLSIVRHALERHDARLQVDSVVGMGSTFSCHFPPSRLQRDTDQARPAQAAINE